jgi:hypothetical protein
MGATAVQPRRVVAEYENYADAQRAVDRLSDRGFPVDRVAIVGRGLRYVEQVAGRMTTARAAALGAADGAPIGALLGLLSALLFTTDPDPGLPLLVLYGLVVGTLLGAALGALTHAMWRGRRDFVSVPGIQADRYEVVVDEEFADRASETLGLRPPARI